MLDALYLFPSFLSNDNPSVNSSNIVIKPFFGFSSTIFTSTGSSIFGGAYTGWGMFSTVSTS